MEFWESMLTTLIIVLVLPVAFSVFWFFKVREEKKLTNKETIKTRPPKILSGFFLGFALLFLCGGTAAIICCCITDGENMTALKVIILSVGFAAFSALGFFGYAYVRFNYVIADAEGLLVYRLFRKKRYYRYEEIACFQDTISMGMMGGLTGYDKDNKKIFAVEAMHIGVSDVAQKLREHEVKQKN